MIPLECAQRVMTWLCLLPPEKSASVWKKRAYIGVFVSMIVGLIVASAASIGFILKSGTSHIDRTLLACSLVNISLGLLYIALIVFFMRRRFSIILKELATIYDQSETTWRIKKPHAWKTYFRTFSISISNVDKDEDFFSILEQTNNKCEWMWKIYFKWIATGNTVSYPLNAVISILFSLYFSGSIKKENLYVPFDYVWVTFFKLICTFNIFTLINLFVSP